MTTELPKVIMPETSQYIHPPDIENVPAHINEMSQSNIFFNICFEDENSSKACRILSSRIIKECKRLYDNLDEFDISSLSLTLSTVTCEGMIKMLKKLKSIGGINTDIVPFKYFINEMLMKY